MVVNVAMIRNSIILQHFFTKVVKGWVDVDRVNLRSQFATSSWGGRRYRPYAFTEQGVAMLSTVLRSKRAVAVNIEIMGAFVRLRRLLASNEELARMSTATAASSGSVRFASVTHFSQPSDPPLR